MKTKLKPKPEVKPDKARVDLVAISKGSGKTKIILVELKQPTRKNKP